MCAFFCLEYLLIEIEKNKIRFCLFFFFVYFLIRIVLLLQKKKEGLDRKWVPQDNCAR
jgi:hypothetical protein